MMSTQRILITLATMFSTSSLTSALHAHPGHGADGGSHEFTHYLSQPAHAIAILTILAASALLVYVLASVRVGRRRACR
jgi:ribose/xylose/arabinose/galactoside ABC-type transport system permease subunit